MLTKKLLQDIERFKSQPENANFESFEIPGDYFSKQEMEYKQELAVRFQEIGTRLMNDNSDEFFKELIDLLSKEKLGASGHVQNLLNYRDYGTLKKVVEDSAENRRRLAKHLREMLEAADSDELIWNKVDEFISCLTTVGLRDAGHTKRWPTFFLFLWRPKKYIFIKPNFFDEMLSSYELDKIGKYTPLNGTLYRAVMDNMSVLKAELTKHLGDTDYIGVQSFLWHVIRTLKSAPTKENESVVNIWLLQPPGEFRFRGAHSTLDWDLKGTDDQVNSYNEYCASFQRDDILVFVRNNNGNEVVGEARLRSVELAGSKLLIAISKLWSHTQIVSTKLNEQLITPGIVWNHSIRSSLGESFCQEYLDLRRLNFLLPWNSTTYSPLMSTDEFKTGDRPLDLSVGDRVKLNWKWKYGTVGDPVYLIRTTGNDQGIFAKARMCDDKQKGKYMIIEIEDVRPKANDRYLTLLELEERLPEQQWSTSAVVVQINRTINSPIRSLWENVAKEPCNTILYGPPGTGKTYELRNKYFPMYTGTSAIESRKERLRQILKDMHWHQVIAATLLKLKKPQSVPEIAQHEYVQIKAQMSDSNDAHLLSSIWGVLMRHTPDKCETVNYSLNARAEMRLFWKNEDKTWEMVHDIDSTETGLQDILSRLEASADEDTTQFQRYNFVTFHQSYSYEEFVEGIRPKLAQDSEQVSYELRPGVFRELCDRARMDPSGARYAIFIDEINRGNISKIFGELITLIEEDKRQGGRNELSVTLPYSRLNFKVPRNLDIYGTMNTADRSLVHIDSALRRRFTFEELTPKPDLLSMVSLKGQDIDLKLLLMAMNERIEELFDREHMIGHAYFLRHRGEPIRGDELPRIFEKKIIPLLTEYFFDDWSKVREVLADDETTTPNCQFVEHSVGTKRGKDVFRLNRPAFTNPNSYTKIYSKQQL